MLYEQGVYGEAIEDAIKSLQFARENIGEKHPNTASSLNTLAFIYHTLGDYLPFVVVFELTSQLHILS